MVLLPNIAYINNDGCCNISIRGKFNNLTLLHISAKENSFISPGDCHLISTSYYALVF